MPPAMISYSIARFIEPGAIIPPEPMSLTTQYGARFDRVDNESLDDFIAGVIAETGEGVVLFENVDAAACQLPRGVTAQATQKLILSEPSSGGAGGNTSGRKGS